jgi:hypothetical protein
MAKKKSSKKKTGDTGQVIKPLEVFTAQTPYVRMARVNGNLTFPTSSTLTAANSNSFTVTVYPPCTGSQQPTAMVINTDPGVGGIIAPTSVSVVPNTGGSVWVVTFAANTFSNTAGQNNYVLRVIGPQTSNPPTAEYDFDAQ